MLLAKMIIINVMSRYSNKPEVLLLVLNSVLKKNEIIVNESKTIFHTFCSIQKLNIPNMLHKSKVNFIVLLFAVITTSCVVVNQDELGVKRKFGAIRKQTLEPGLKVINPFTTTVLKVPARTINLEVELDLPSKEGLTIRSEVSILYNLQASQVPTILEKSGIGYEREVILPVFRSAVADVTARFFAKDMHTAQRAEIEKEVRDQMHKLLQERGFNIEAVLLKSVRLPAGLSRAIEEKLQAEQEAQRMEFVLNREKLEAERRKIEAEGIRDAQKIISEGLNPMIIQFKSIEAFKELAGSSNSKVVITDGKTPMLISNDQK